MSIRAIQRRHGWRKAIAYGACRLLQRILTLDVTYVMISDTAPTPLPVSRADLQCRFLTSREVVEFAQDPTNDLDPSLAFRLDTGYDYCFAGLVEGRLASYCWLALDSIEATHNRSTESEATGIAYSYPPEYAFRYKGYTHPDFRGQQLYAQVSHAASQAIRELGVNHVISTAEVVNFGANNSSHRCGYKVVGISVLVGLGTRVWIFPPDLTSRGITIGRAAKVLERRKLAADPMAEVGSPSEEALTM